jgi:hypothetical protein
MGKFLHLKKMKAAEIHSELVLFFVHYAYTLPSVHYWVNEDDPRSGSPPPGDVDAANLKRLLEAVFSSLWTFSEDLHIPKGTIWEYMTNSLGFQCRHFKWFSYMVTKEFQRKRADGAKALLKVLDVQSCIDFPDAITRDESQIFLKTGPG